MRLINYLYYKIYKSFEKSSVSDMPAFFTACYFAALIEINFFVLNAFLAKLDVAPLLLNSKPKSVISILVLIATIYIYIYIQKKSLQGNIIEIFWGIRKGKEKRQFMGFYLANIYSHFHFFSCFFSPWISWLGSKE
jgi:hypothetical protein